MAKTLKKVNFNDKILWLFLGAAIALGSILIYTSFAARGKYEVGLNSWLPTLGEQIRIAATASPTTINGKPLYIRTQCTQNGQIVFSHMSNPVNATWFPDDFQFGPTDKWTSGDAQCTSELGYYGKSGNFQTNVAEPLKFTGYGVKPN